MFLTFVPAGLAVGLAADVVEGEAMEEGTGGVWGGTCNYREKIIIATSITYFSIIIIIMCMYIVETTMFVQGKGDYLS